MEQNPAIHLDLKDGVLDLRGGGSSPLAVTVLVQAQEDREADYEVQPVEGRSQPIDHGPVLELLAGNRSQTDRQEGERRGEKGR